MDRRQIFTRLFGLATGAAVVAAFPASNAVAAAALPDAPGALDREARAADWAKKGGKGVRGPYKSRGRGNAFGRRRKFGF